MVLRKAARSDAARAAKGTAAGPAAADERGREAVVADTMAGGAAVVGAVGVAVGEDNPQTHERYSAIIVVRFDIQPPERLNISCTHFGVFRHPKVTKDYQKPSRTFR